MKRIFQSLSICLLTGLVGCSRFSDRGMRGELKCPKEKPYVRYALSDCVQYQLQPNPYGWQLGPAAAWYGGKNNVLPDVIPDLTMPKDGYFLSHR